MKVGAFVFLALIACGWACYSPMSLLTIGDHTDTIDVWEWTLQSIRNTNTSKFPFMQRIAPMIEDALTKKKQQPSCIEFLMERMDDFTDCVHAMDDESFECTVKDTDMMDLMLYASMRQAIDRLMNSDSDNWKQQMRNLKQFMEAQELFMHRTDAETEE